MDLGLAGRKAIVTGAARGIGEATVAGVHVLWPDGAETQVANPATDVFLTVSR